MVAARAHLGMIKAVVGRAAGLVCGRVVLDVGLPLFVFFGAGFAYLLLHENIAGTG